MTKNEFEIKIAELQHEIKMKDWFISHNRKFIEDQIKESRELYRELLEAKETIKELRARLGEEDKPEISKRPALRIVA
ncbi:hypothetical protein GRG99_002395 [Salmonella enterica subsp. enterica serovar Virchow]|nr:hypothetical protein [Salmonella enterica subsp. enterica serovar Virchow]